MTDYTTLTALSAEAAEAKLARLEGALRIIAEAKAKTNSAANVQTIWDMAQTARAALTEGTPE